MTKATPAPARVDVRPDFASGIEAASRAGTLRALLARRYYEGEEVRRDFDHVLVDLHNKGSIDAVAVLTELGKSNGKESDFFDVQLVFRDILPKIDADVAAVISAVVDIVHAGEGAGMAGLLIDPLTQFCAAKPGRAEEAFRLILEDPPRYAFLFAAVLAAGLVQDRGVWAERAIDLLKTEDRVLLRHAVFALTRPEFASDEALRTRTLLALKATIAPTADDHVLASAVRAIFALRPAGGFDEEGRQLLDDVLAAGGDSTLHAGVETLWLNKAAGAPDVAVIVFKHGERINPDHKGTLHRADMAMLGVLGGPCEAQAVAFFELYSVANVERLAPETFEHFLRKIAAEHKELFGRLIVKWFHSGEQVLYAAIRWLVMNGVDQDASMPVEAIASVALEPGERIFTARKAIGHLFFRPKAATEIILAILRNADPKTATILEDHLFDPMLVNYAGPLEPFLNEQRQSASVPVKRCINSALERWRVYIDGIKTVGAIKELWPSERQRAITHQRFADESAAAMREAEQNSVLLSLVSKSVVLYGRASIHSFRGPGGQKRRTVTHLQSHSFIMDVPSMEMVNPFGLDYQLRVMRVERIKR
jgi:hypothetical protein